VKSNVVARIAMILAALFAGAALSAAGKPAKPARAPNWNQTVTLTDRDSYVLGNPAAQVKLVEFISYTCPHCAHFEQQSADQLRLGFIAQGKGSVEVRNFVRDPVDLTVSLLVRCGPKEKFFTNHSVFLRSQSTWMAPLEDISPSERQRWFMADLPDRLRYIAADFHFYEIMGTLGYNRTAVDRCLADTALAARLASHTEEAEKTLFVRGTPTFMVDGIVLAGTSEWSALRPQLEARMR
jgi:protein-disulfide isomerase